MNDQMNPPRYEEEQHNAMFGKRKLDLLEGRVKKLEAQVNELEKYSVMQKQVDRLSKLIDPYYWP